MAELLAFSQSSLLSSPLPPLCSSRPHRLITNCTNASLSMPTPSIHLSTRLTMSPTSISGQNQRSCRTVAGVVPDPNVPTTIAVMSLSQKLTLGYAALLGIGGAMGYLKGGSQISLIAGGISACILYYVYTILPSDPVLASSIGLVVSASLFGAMGLRFQRTGKIFPVGVVCLVALAMTGGYLHGILRSLH